MKAMEKGRDEGRLADRMLGLALSDSHSPSPPPPPLPSSSASNNLLNPLPPPPPPPRDDDVDDDHHYHCYVHTNNNHNTLNSMNNTTTSSSSNNNNDSLFEVMKAVQTAEATIKQQVEENTRLRTELQKKIQELETYKLGEPRPQRSHSADAWNEHFHYEAQSVPSLENQEYKAKHMSNTASADPSSPLVLHHNLKNSGEHPTMQHHMESQSNSTKINETLKVLPGGQAPGHDAGLSQLSSQSTKSFSPSRYQIPGEYDPQLSLSGHELMQMSEVNNTSSLLKQDFALKIRDHEVEISQLRKHLADYSIKEAQICDEKYALEKRIAYMRLAFDQQQHDLVDSASKSLSYRQGIIEENIHLTFVLQAAQQERTTFVSSLLPLLVDYSLQPQIADAQSIVSNVKVLLRHLQEKLFLTKLKESQYQLAPLQLDTNLSNLGPQQSSPSIVAPLANLDKERLELVRRPTYPHGKMATTSYVQTGVDLDKQSQHQSSLGGAVAKSGEPNGVVQYSPLASRDSAVHEVPMTMRGVVNTVYNGEGLTNKQVMFREPFSNSEMDETGAEGHQNERGIPAYWGSGTSPYTAAPDDPNSSYSPYLPPVLEENSSFSDAADDDKLPAVDSLQISGEAFPGRELLASGYSINGTTSCIFEWVRHLEDGSVNYIHGAKQPNYLVTADDVDAYLAIEVQPLDDQKRKGELVKVFANEHRKITCDPEMQSHIEKMLYDGHVLYKVSLSMGYLDLWEPATLAIRREGYSIKCTSPDGGVITNKFLPNINIKIPYGPPNEFRIIGSSGFEHLLRVDNNSTDTTCSRDAIVITLRLFIKRASERKKGKRKRFFFGK